MIEWLRANSLIPVFDDNLIVNGGLVPAGIVLVGLAVLCLRTRPKRDGVDSDASADRKQAFAGCGWAAPLIVALAFIPADLMLRGAESETVVRYAWNSPSFKGIVWPDGATDRLLPVVLLAGLIGSLRGLAPSRGGWGWLANGLAAALLARVVILAVVWPVVGTAEAPSVLTEESAIAIGVGVWVVNWLMFALFSAATERETGASVAGRLLPMAFLCGLALHQAGASPEAQQSASLTAVLGSVMLVGLFVKRLRIGPGVVAPLLAAVWFAVFMSQLYSGWQPVLPGVLLVIAPAAALITLAPPFRSLGPWARFSIGLVAATIAGLLVVRASLETNPHAPEDDPYASYNDNAE